MSEFAQRVECLPESKRARVGEIACSLAGVPGVEAVVIGGSCARGTARPDSDVDLGVYYWERAPLAVDAVRSVAQRFAAGSAPTVTALYEWGPWVNGGAWIKTSVGKVDVLYRNLDQVRRVIDDAHRGRIEWHFGQQPPYGFQSVIYLAETLACVPLHDPAEVVPPLKRDVTSYPRALKEVIVRESLWSTEFSLHHARAFAAAGDVYNGVGCLTRVACLLTQALFALNEVYFMTDKDALDTIEAFPQRPDGYRATVSAILAHPGATPAELGATAGSLATVVSQVVALAADLYQPKYVL